MNGRGRPNARGERGWVTLWVLGLCVAVLFLGGLSLDLWRALAVRRDLAARADAAAAAGATAVDPAALRVGQLVIDPDLARGRALEVLGRGAGAPDLELVAVDVFDNRVIVTVRAEVPFTLLRVLAAGAPFTVEARARAEPRRVP